MTTATKAITLVTSARIGNKKLVIFDIAISIYTTGGVAFTPSLLGLTTIESMHPGIALGGDTQPNTFTYDPTTNLMWAWGYPAAQAADISDAANAGTARMLAVGY